MKRETGKDFKWSKMEDLKKEIQDFRANLPIRQKWDNVFEYTWKYLIFPTETKEEQQKRVNS